jgi:hypothetical protein
MRDSSSLSVRWISTPKAQLSSGPGVCLDFACPRKIAFLIENLGAAVEARQRWCAEFPTLKRICQHQASLKIHTTTNAWLGESKYLEGRFTVGDLMMISVLRILRHTELLDTEPGTKAYRARCEGQPAFERTLSAQTNDFKKP